jgi:hypothetical protein
MADDDASKEWTTKAADVQVVLDEKKTISDLVMIFPRRSGGELKEPSRFTQTKFVKKMLGLYTPFSLSKKAMLQNELQSVLRTPECFILMNGLSYDGSYPPHPTGDNDDDCVDQRSVDDTQSYNELKRRMDCLRQEYDSFIGSSQDTTEEKFCELVARAVSMRIQLTCGLTTKMFKSTNEDTVMIDSCSFVSTKI